MSWFSSGASIFGVMPATIPSTGPSAPHQTPETSPLLKHPEAVADPCAGVAEIAGSSALEQRVHAPGVATDDKRITRREEGHVAYAESGTSPTQRVLHEA